jgi:DNA (cytosine-5)-methyltransferase 1
MKKFKVLNLYACLGGNRYKWDEVAAEAGIELEVTAVELDPELARLYQERFPNDKVIVADAHAYLLDHYKEFYFIWSSPPCTTHSKMKLNQAKGTGNHLPIFPDMKLYAEILFLKHYFHGKYCVENVIPYYEPLIPAQKRGRHLYWTNFKLPNDLGGEVPKSSWNQPGLSNLERYHEITDLLINYKAEKRKDSMINNLVDYKAGRTIFETALNITRANNVKQNCLF